MSMMTSPRGHSGSRALGNVKVKGTIFPPLTRVVNGSSQQYFTEQRMMVQGDGMDLALYITAKGSDKEEPPSLARSSSRHVTSKVDVSNSKVNQDIKEHQTREKQYKNKIISLQKFIDQLKLDLKGKDRDLAAVHQKLQEIEEHYRLLYEKECSDHCLTKNNLRVVTGELEESSRLAEELKRKHEERLEEVKHGYEEKLAASKEEHDKEIQDRDERIARMKKQMADFLKGNSRERQQQLEELTKELGKVSEEASDLRMKLKSFLKNKQCVNCHLLSAEVSEKRKRIMDHEGSINELMSICQKFETQLMQQDILLTQFGAGKEQKANIKKNFTFL